ncbi:hypothetical protein TraAM80_04725 [Trypanosoma rangeli]|uniref:Uncharacterized protein n=1 Tax=Trypanosoma rangeli TaxID=5698 RepID=A0A3R7KC02_TRYRA|nr:uncharacterized protein TraAM80_04725 [Trypanosoma rangeli]RNF05079.1 hypothetical protein TraAM80_04725 [Trypanosoma rangeli]|eukprot:RNF05079.1 hypothetical protein TraAM80_04725 [Trypanosoma rangeli]
MLSIRAANFALNGVLLLALKAHPVVEAGVGKPIELTPLYLLAFDRYMRLQGASIHVTCASCGRVDGWDSLAALSSERGAAELLATAAEASLFLFPFRAAGGRRRGSVVSVMTTFLCVAVTA